jgi:N-acetylneuraminic acid mutarotase
VLGGNSGCFLNTFYKYNHPTNTWSTLANYPGVGRGNTVLMVINGRVFAGMGRDWLCTIGNFNDFSEYLPVANNWVAKANYNGTAGYTFGYFVLGDYGYVIDQNLDVNRYDPVMNTWTRLACKCPIIPDFVGVANGKAYVISTSGQGTYEFTP